MRINMEAEIESSSGIVMVGLRVRAYGQEFGAAYTLGLSEVESIYDLVVRDLQRNVKEALLRVQRARERTELIPLVSDLMPTFKVVRNLGG